MLPARQRDTRPNIILIVLDDMRADDLAMMPAVQELLVAPGISFTNFLATAPTCAPARASILRGQYPHNHGVLGNNGDQGGFAPFYTLGHEQSTVATWVQDAGYRTGFIGKYLNGYPYDSQLPSDVPATYFPPGWDEWAGVTKEPYFKLEVNENGDINVYKKHYATDVLATKAINFVSQTTQPFFLYLAPRAPHEPAEYAPRHATAFAGTTAPRPPSFNEADVRDKPAWVQASPGLDAAQVAALDAHHVARLRTLLAVDELVADLIEELRRTGTLDRTFILLTSDNGYHLGEHRIAEDKGSPYEEAIRMPLVVRGPGVPAGQTLPALASQVDLAPTIAAWAEAAVPDFVDGRSLAPLLAGEAPPPWRQAVLVKRYAAQKEGGGGKPGFDALRAEDVVYIEVVTGERELYDLARDPYQLDNLAASVDAGYIATLSERLAALTACAGETCRVLEDMPLPG
jgi:arylsulfatase A-like enzyme